MAADPKNIFNFGTGDIDKDQWLKDIDNGQEEFITTYGSATNKHRTALLRQAFQDLRSRLASGDMLRRNSDGMYEFSSALNRDDKHMQEAYERALGFMGNLARKQINTPKPEPEKKKVTGSTLEDEFKKSLGPDGRYNETAYWARTPEARSLGLQQFLTGFKNRLNDYQDFSSFTDRAGLEAKIDAAIQALNNKKYNDWSISELGFTKDWINKPKDEDEEEQEEKSEKEKLQEQLESQNEQQQVQALRQVVDLNNKSSVNAPLFFNLPSYSYQQELDKYLKESTDDRAMFYRGSINGSTDKDVLQNAYISAKKGFNSQERKNLENYFSSLGTNYISNYSNKETRQDLLNNLAKLFSTSGNDYNFKDLISKYLTSLGNGKYYINGSLNKDGHYTYFMPKSLNNGQAGLFDASIGRPEDQNDYIQSIYKQIYKNGGIIKFQNGGISAEEYKKYVDPYLHEQKQQEQQQQLKTSRDPFDNWTTGDYALLGSAAADVASMAASYIPGGQLASGLIGAGSTLTSSAVDFARGNYMSGGTNLVLGLGADIAGMLPVVGTAAKTAKIAKTLGKLSKVLVPAFTVMGATQASGAMAKLIKGESLTPEDWQGLSQGIQLIISGGAKGVAGHKNAAFKRTQAEGVTHYDVKLKDGTNTRITKEEFEGAKRNDYKGTAEQNILGKIKGKPVVTKEGINSAHKNIVSESLNPLNSASTSQYNYMLNKAGDNGYQIKAWTTPEWSPLKHLQERRLSAIQKIESQKTSDTSKPRKKSTRTPKKKISTEKKELGGILKALRNGGIIKAQGGVEFPSLKGYATDAEWADLNFGTTTQHNYADNGFSNREKGGLGWSRGLYNNGVDNNLYQDLNSARQAQYNYYTMDEGKNIFGDVLSYYNEWKQANPTGNYAAFIQQYNKNVDDLRTWNKKKLNTKFNASGWTGFNDLFHKMYRSYGRTWTENGIQDDWSDKLKDFFGESTARRVPSTFDNHTQFAELRNGLLNNEDEKSRVGIDNEGKLFIYNQEDGVKESTPAGTDGSGTKAKGNAVDTSGERQTITQTDFKNPFDPSHLITAGKLFQAIRGNANIYGNLLKEMPQAPLRDPIHRQLAIVGNQRVIDEARNKIGDLRQINRQQFGSDQQTNFATSLETERTGRDIYDKSLDQDATRQFDTAQKLWNLKNEDTFYNTKVGDDNRKSIADRARMMAQIRAAWRSGDQNAIMGALADEGNWFMKKYQREQDIVNLAREQQLGSREQFLENYIRDKHKDYDALKAKLADPKVSDAEKAQIRNTIQQWNLEILREAPAAWSQKIYNAFHTPGFGGGYKTSLIGKDGVKLEVEKLKARGKDNDRYVSMIKDLRKTSYRRRRR